MTSLIALLSTGKGSWLYVMQLINSQKFEKIFLITNQFGKEKFTPTEKTELVVVNLKSDAKTIMEAILKQLKGKISDTEVALNLTSGTGTEHMAVLSACLHLGVGVRLVEVTDRGIVEI